MSKSQNELPYELENQFILRLPPEHASAVRTIIHSGSVTLKDKIKIDLSSDGRHAVVEVEDVSLPAKLVDLPCVVGSLKTFDKKSFYKTADISQMLVCSADGNIHSSFEEPVVSTYLNATRIEMERIYIWKHGITPPLKNVRKKRFRKTKKKDIESPGVEKELKRLLCSDSEAVGIRWEVIADDETKEIESQGFVASLPVSPGVSGYKQGDTSSEHDVLREMLSDSNSNTQDNEEEKEEEEEGEEEDEEDEGEEEDEEEDDFEETLERKLQANIIEYCLHETKEGASSIVREIQKHIHYKEKKLQEIQNKAQRQKNIIRKVENLTLKNHLESVLENLKVQEKQKNDQITSLQKQLNHFLQK
ncbi:transcription initiation factor TFIID subunit 7-like [Octodon degus]|uniref:Transcription initiation factor TFIID subunit 7-like n=1 Tax=Octodon degus TaxID=10160 RepID=A0A6P3V994_OCTDE|nr:transcription initiation factor TFIID subunit 7-like [Octodon degus]